MFDPLGHQFHRDRDLDPKDQLLSLGEGLDLFRRKLRFGGYEADDGGNGIVGQDVQHDPCLGAEGKKSGFGGRQENLHVDIFQAEERQDRAPRRNDLARFGKPIQHTARSGGRQLTVVDLALNASDFSVGCRDCGFQCDSG